MKVNQNWLLDLLFDRQVFEAQYADLPVNIGGNVQIIKSWSGSFLHVSCLLVLRAAIARR